jgi:hypothetical protein
MKNYLLLFLMCMISFSFFSISINAQWSTNPAVNNAICVNYYNKSDIQIISDGSGGAIISWSDYRFQPKYTVFAQRINSGGILQWTPTGVQVSIISDNYTGRISTLMDGNGGAIITWVSGGDFGNLYAQHLNSAGILQWDTNGVIICSTTVSTSAVPKIVSDGNGGGIIAWSDNRTHVDDDLYAQRINSNGVVQWTINGMPVARGTGFQGAFLQMTSDGSGGAIITWYDDRSGTTTEIYAQKINGGGGVLWDTVGVLLNSVTGGSLYPQLISDAGGAIICWVDRRNGNTDYNIYAQKVNASGAIQWTVNGAPICLKTGNQDAPQIVTDGKGGVIITWNELGFGLPDANLYAQRVNAVGTTQWATNGVGVCLAAGNQGLPQLTSDGNGGAVITWIDSRADDNDIYAQRIDSGGSALWTNNGVAISTAPHSQTDPVILNDGNNGFILAWADIRSYLNGFPHDIYAQRVNSNGTLGGVTGVNENVHSLPAAFTITQNYPNPFNPNTTIKYQIPQNCFVSLKVYDILGNEIKTLVNDEKPAGNYELTFNATNFPSGVYFYRLQAGSFVETKKMILLK